MSEPTLLSWYQRHRRKLESGFLAVMVLLVCNNLAAVLGYTPVLEAWHPLSSLMLSTALLINALVMFMRIRSAGVLIVLSLGSIALLIGSSMVGR